MRGLSVFNIQRYSIHDGDGIRTTIFFKGCPLRCAWCHNGESWNPAPELMWDEEKCVRCGACAAVCPHGAASAFRLDRSLCAACGSCVQSCPAGARQLSGRRYTPEELVALVARDTMFYDESGGGVTLSGGEVMAAEPFTEVERLCELLREEGIRVFVDTSGMAPWERFALILGDVDCFLYDIKAMDSDKHRKWIGADNTLILDNLRRLSKVGVRIRLRLPLIEGVNAGPEDILPIIGLLRDGVRAEKIHLLPYHEFGREKFGRLGRDSRPFRTPTPEKLESLAELFRKAGYPQVVIGG